MKRSAKTLILLLIFVIFAGGYWLMSNTGSPTQVNEESGTFDLTAKTIDDLTGLQWTKNDISYHFTKADDAWANADNAAFPVAQEAVQTLADDLVALQASRKLEAVTDLAAYGLAEPSFTVTAQWSDGTSTTYAMGDATPFADGYYLTTGQEGVAYTVVSSLSSMFSKSMTDLAQMETIPTAETVTRMTVGTALDVYYQETSRTINADQHWYDAAGNALDGVDDLVANAQAIEWNELVAPIATEEELSAWLLNEAAATMITMYSGETEAVKLLIGDKDDSGNYYARLPGSSMVYTVTSSSLSTLLSATTENLLSTVLVETEYANVQEATFATADKTYVLTPVTAEDSAETPDEATTEATEDSGEDIWSALTAITATTHAEPASGDTLLTVTMTTTDGKTATITFAAYDVDHYTAAMDSRTLLVSADKVDKLIRAVKAIQ